MNAVSGVEDQKACSMVALEFSHWILATMLKGPKRCPGFNCPASLQIPEFPIATWTRRESGDEEHMHWGLHLHHGMDYTHMHVQEPTLHWFHYKCVQTSSCQVHTNKHTRETHTKHNKISIIIILLLGWTLIVIRTHTLALTYEIPSVHDVQCDGNWHKI